ncbi:MAG: hypothetical protein H7Z12_08385 [Rhodospirillaceae bacterium]|nr:hypothetical protein [Rhodospirillales bacterium]
MTYADYKARWEPVRRRIFVEKPSPYFVFPFLDPAWEVLPIPNDPTRLPSPESWLNYEGAPDVHDEYAPLFATLRERGVDRMMLWPVDRFVTSESYATGDPSKYVPIVFPFEVSPTREAMAAVLRDKGFDANSHPSYFSAKADWGLQTFWEEVSILAGTPDFMECFYRHAGGRDTVRQRFIDYDVGGAWAFAHHSRYDKSGPYEPDEYPFYDAPRKEFYDMIGCSMPAYDMEQIKTEYPFLFRKPDDQEK